jgi:hypothetical protein
MLKLTSYHNPRLSIWVPCAGIVIEEQEAGSAGPCTQIWVAGMPYVVQESPEQIMAMDAMVCHLHPARGPVLGRLLHVPSVPTPRSLCRLGMCVCKGCHDRHYDIQAEQVV